jgi:phage I-like protein
MVRVMPDLSASLSPVFLTALSLPDAGGAAPSEIMLLPAPLSDMRTVDGRGPWRLSDPQSLIARSMGLNRNGGKLRIDVNHATEKLGRIGMEAPARGWITSLFVRDDALWANVEWTEAGRAMVAAREYLSISPEIIPDANGEISQIVGASLTNDPALLGLATLTTRENSMSDLLAPFAAKLGKPATTPSAELLAAMPDPQVVVQLTALQADVATLLTALGVKDIGAAKAAVEALQTQRTTVETLTAQVAALEKASKTQAAEAWMASEIAAKRGIPADKRAGLIELFTRNPDEARHVASLYPVLAEQTHLGGTPPGAGAAVTLTAEQITAKATTLMAERKAAGITLTFTEAVQAVTAEAAK